ncbi:MAG TPA: hypothetical protein VLA74_04420 [Nitrososphaeraceae archaeon]|nr:hypothetical protein [Nitrososphaeraceae archaeon]
MSGSSNEHNIIIGKWTKITNSECSNLYPDNLEFKERGIYRGFKGLDKKEFTIWDAGSYEIIDNNQMKISTANDAEILYNFSIHDNTLEFLDENRCKFRYQKESNKSS